VTRQRTRLVWIALLVAFGLVYIEPMWLFRELVADDSSYWAHAATLGLDFDLDYSNEPVQWWNRDRTIASHPIGSGLLAAPFVAVFSVVDRVLGHPVIDDHGAYLHSWSFFGFFLAALFYFLLGVWLYWRGLRRLFPRLDPRLNLLFALSTGVPFYVLRRATMSHAFEFAGLALAFWAAVELYAALAEGRGARKWLILAAAAVPLNLAIRIANLNAIFLSHLVVLLVWLFADPDRPAWATVRSALLRLSGWIVVAYLPFAVFNVVFFGSPYPTPSSMYSRGLENVIERSFGEMLVHGIGLVPNIVPLVFSSEFGLLYTNPVLVIGGLYILWAVAVRLIDRWGPPQALAAVGALAYLGFNTAIVLWWQTTATSYGYRYLFPLYPVALFGLVLLLRRVRSHTDDRATGIGARLRRAALPTVIALCGLSLVSQTFFSANEALEVRRQVNVFGVEHGASARGYLSRLPGEMLEPGTWATLAARRLIGFYGAPLVVGSELRSSVPESWLESYRRLYADAPPGVVVQLTLLLLTWAAGAYAVGPAQRVRVGHDHERRTRRDG
jgi:hypothetical protein